MCGQHVRNEADVGRTHHVPVVVVLAGDYVGADASLGEPLPAERDVVVHVLAREDQDLARVRLSVVSAFGPRVELQEVTLAQPLGQGPPVLEAPTGTRAFNSVCEATPRNHTGPGGPRADPLRITQHTNHLCGERCGRAGTTLAR